MGYEVHITRKEMFFDTDGEDISLQEWIDYVHADKDMRLDGYAEANTPDGVLRVEDESLAVWLGWSRHDIDGGMAWMHHFNGSIVSKNPDQETLKKFYQIAQLFDAKVQGDEGEVYDENGDSNWDELKAESSKGQTNKEKRWWQFWA